MYQPRLKVKYTQEVIPTLQKKFSFSSPMQVPTLKAIYINQGLAKYKDQHNALQSAQKNLSLIAGQKAIFRTAKHAISNFKLRAGMTIATSVTLRGNRMWEFADKLFNLGLARVRDFRGVKVNAFDQQGNYTLGIKEQIIFPEINIEQIHAITGMNVTFVLSSRNKTTNYALLRALGMPFADLHQKE